MKTINSPLISLIFANIISIIVVILGNWNISEILFLYMLQGIIICSFIPSKIGASNKFTKEELKIAKIKLFLYFVYILSINVIITVLTYDLQFESNASVFFIMLTITIFIFNHMFSFFKYNLKFKLEKTLPPKYTFSKGYLRIVPLHLTLFLGIYLSNIPDGILIFLITKSVVDVLAHILEHRVKPSKTISRSKGFSAKS